MISLRPMSLILPPRLVEESLDQDVKKCVGVIFDAIQHRYNFDHKRIIPVFAISLGMAEAYLLQTNSDFTKTEVREASEKIVNMARDVGLQA